MLTYQSHKTRSENLWKFYEDTVQFQDESVTYIYAWSYFTDDITVVKPSKSQRQGKHLRDKEDVIIEEVLGVGKNIHGNLQVEVHIECQLGALVMNSTAPCCPSPRLQKKGLILAKLRNGALAQWSVVYVQGDIQS